MSRFSKSNGCAVIIFAYILIFALIFLAIKRSKVRSQEPNIVVIVRLSCNKTPMILDMLEKQYKELPIGGGLNSLGGQVRLFNSHNAGNKQTWTVILSSPNGLSCILNSGYDWVVAPPITKGDPT